MWTTSSRDGCLMRPSARQNKSSIVSSVPRNSTEIQHIFVFCHWSGLGRAGPYYGNSSTLAIPIHKRPLQAKGGTHHMGIRKQGCGLNMRSKYLDSSFGESPMLVLLIDSVFCQSVVRFWPRQQIPRWSKSKIAPKAYLSILAVSTNCAWRDRPRISILHTTLVQQISVDIFGQEFNKSVKEPSGHISLQSPAYSFGMKVLVQEN